MPDAVTAIVHDANFIVAHGGALLPCFAARPGACSPRSTGKHGFGSARLPYLLVESGLLHVAYRAVADRQAIIRLSSSSLPSTNRTALRSLLVPARQVSFRVPAERAPFELVDT
jgi:DNA polymerase-3 subunit epsilon